MILKITLNGVRVRVEQVCEVQHGLVELLQLEIRNGSAKRALQPQLSVRSAGHAFIYCNTNDD